MFKYENLLGTIESVDTAIVIITIKDEEKLKTLQVNQLIAIQSPKTGQHLIGLISKIMSKSIDSSDENFSNNIIKVLLVGTFFEKIGSKENVLKRTLATVPTLKSSCEVIENETLKILMQSVSSSSENGSNALSLGHYAVDTEAEAIINGDKFFQRHAVIVGSTGSGKSWTVATVLEQVATLENANCILFDIHGEYSSLIDNNFTHFKIAGPHDEYNDKNIYIPYWLLTYEEMISLLLDRSDNNAPNQAMIFSQEVLKLKELSLDNDDNKEISITLDSPVPYRLSELILKLEEIDTEMVPGKTTEKQGPYHGKLTRFIQRLDTKKNDKRLNFMFSENSNVLEYQYLNNLCTKLMNGGNKKGIKIIDFSEVPSDILPLIVSLLARIIFTVQQWSEKDARFPIALFCDEAHLYIPENTYQSIDEMSLHTFERIAKEGRKYGVGLVVISQRPSEVNKTVLSQSANYIIMKLTNTEDQAVVKKLLPDSLGDYTDILPTLDIGEALVVGDASLLPNRVYIKEPTLKPISSTIDFWSIWSKNDKHQEINVAVESLRNQSRN